MPNVAVDDSEVNARSTPQGPTPQGPTPQGPTPQGPTPQGPTRQGLDRGNRRRRYLKPTERITTPLVRENGELRVASWDEALSAAAQGLARVRDRYGGEAFGMFSCSKSTNEMNYAAQKFIRCAMRSNNIDSCNRT